LEALQGNFQTHASRNDASKFEKKTKAKGFAVLQIWPCSGGKIPRDHKSCRLNFETEAPHLVGQAL